MFLLRQPTDAQSRRFLATQRDQRYASAGAMQLDLERFLKESEALGTSQLLGEYVQREVPRPPDEDAAGPGTQAQPAGTQRQIAGTEVQPAGTEAIPDGEVSPAQPHPAAGESPDASPDDSMELAITTPGHAKSDAPTRPVENPRRKPEPRGERHRPEPVFVPCSLSEWDRASVFGQALRSANHRPASVQYSFGCSPASALTSLNVPSPRLANSLCVRPLNFFGGQTSGVFPS